jgi:trans-2,3-dihydro-3-hydroxyanthranilate isomerase
MPLSYQTVDVFTDIAFGGNPLAVVFGGEELSDARMFAIAREFNYSETTFVLPPKDPAHTAHVRIFTTAGEVPFAGHPNVGTATVIAWRGELFGKPVAEHVIFEEAAGLVPISVLVEEDKPVGATLTAPQAYSTAGMVDVTEVAACIGLRPEDIRTDNHAPLIGSVGLPFVLVELTNRAALEKTRAVGPAFETSPAIAPTGAIHCYVQATPDDDVDLRSRMFAPAHGADEDPATGSANCALIGQLAAMEPGRGTLRKRIAQGVEMGRPSLLLAEADHDGGEVPTVRIGGRCVAMMRGEILI